MKVHRYYGGNLPCVFEHQALFSRLFEGEMLEIEVTIPATSAGKTVVALAGWSDAMDYPHYMASPPFFTVNGRRLSENVSKEVLKNAAA